MNTKTGDGDEVEELGLFMVSDRGGVQPIWIDVEIEGKTVSMELDTGAAVSICPALLGKLFSRDKP